MNTACWGQTVNLKNSRDREHNQLTNCHCEHNQLTQTVNLCDCEHNQLTQNCQREWLWTQSTDPNCQREWLCTQSNDPQLSAWMTVNTINWPKTVSVSDCEHNQLTQNCQREWLWTQPTHTNCQLAWLWTQSTHTNCQREWLWTQLTDPNCQLQKVSLLWTQLAARNGQLLGTVSWPKHSSCQVQKEMLLWTQLADQNCQLQQEPWLNISWGEGTGGGVLTWFSLFFSPCPGPLLSLNKVSGTFGAIMSIGHYNKRRYGSRLSLSSVGKWPKPFRQCAAFLGLTSNMTASVSWDLRSLANTPQSCED